jgi:drug/metabolite transporter (DMT)-like permease
LSQIKEQSTVRQSRTGREKDVSGNSDVLGPLAVLLATACWGTSGLFVKLILANHEVSALALAFWRDLSTFVVLLVGLLLLRPRWLRVRREDLPSLLGLGCSIGVFHIFWNLAVFLNGAAVATVQQATMPAIVTIAAWFAWREALTMGKILAIILTFVGTVMVSDVNVLRKVDLTHSGFLVGLATPMAYAGWNLFMKKVRQDHNPFTTLTYGFGIGAGVLLPIQFFTAQPWPVTPAALGYFAGLIGVATIGGFSIYTFALGRLQAGVATILAMAEIPIVAVYAYVLLGERMTATQGLGAMLVMVGVLILSGRPKAACRGSTQAME